MISKKERWFSILSFVNEEYIDESNPLKQSQEQPVKKIKENKTWSHFVFGNKVAISINTKKIFAIAVSACLIVAALLVGIIVPSLNKPLPETTRLEWGFKYGDGDEISSDSCAYRSESNTFDIENVTLTFYFGGAFSPDINLELESGRNIPTFDIYFGDSNHEPIYTIRHSTDNYVSEEYRVSWIFDENYNITEFVYNHSESITIPQDLFSEDQGVIRFCIGGIDINEIEHEYKTIACAYINYDVVDGKVILSPWDGYRN